MNLQQIALKDLIPPNDLTRPSDDLINSIKADGILHPLIVKEDGTIICGRERWKAARFLGHATVPCRIVRDTDMICVSWIHPTVSRIETKPVEFAQQLKRIMELHPTLSKAELALKMQKSVSWIENQLSLLKLPRDVAQKVDAGEIPRSEAYILAKRIK